MTGGVQDGVQQALLQIGVAHGSEVQPAQILKVALRGRQFVGRAFLFHVAEFVVDRRHRCQEGLEVECAAAQLGVAGAIGDHVLEVEAPVAIAIALEVAHGVAVVRPKLPSDQSSSTSVYPMARTAARVPSGSRAIAWRTAYSSRPMRCSLSAGSSGSSPPAAAAPAAPTV